MQSPDPSLNAFEKTLAHEILISERLRATILIALFAFLSLITFIGFTFFFQPINELFHGRLPVSAIVAVLAFGLGYEMLAWAMFNFFIKRKQQPPLIGRYGNALIDTSIPTVIILMTLGIFDPVYALLLPPSLIYFVFIMLSTLRLDFWLSLFTGIVAAAEYLILAALYLSPNPSLDPMMTAFPSHLSKAGIYILTGLVSGFVAIQIKRQFTNSLKVLEERNKIVSMFGQHVSPSVAEKLLAQPDLELDGETRHVCVMFLDIRDFTAFAEKKNPEEVMRYLNALFEFMIDSVNRHDGIINKFLGDGFMAVFGAPISSHDDVRNAVRASLEILEKVDAMNDSKVIPPTRVGIGLHAGEAVTGNVGSTLRKEYTVIGDVVNLASRIEQLNKQFSSRLLVSDAVWNVIREETKEAALLGDVHVKGHDALVQVYKLA